MSSIVHVLLGLLILIFAAKTGAVLAVRFKQPAVLGELLAGIVIGNLALLGFDGFNFLKNNHELFIFAELGVVILLFEVGLESNLKEMMAVGVKSFAVASLGVLAPFVLGYYVSDFLIPDLSNITRIFIGATLTATSVGITARVFKDLSCLQFLESRIVLGAAVIDDILGLIILAVVSNIATTGSLEPLSVILISLKAIAFLVLAVFLGIFFAKRTLKILAERWNVPGMMLSAALIACLLGAYLADLFGLAPIVGAFSAGLVLDEVYFKDFNSQKTLEDYIQPISFFLVPLFFVITGLNVDISVLADPVVLQSSLALCLLAIFSKIISGWSFPSREKLSRLLIGVGMIPRGEVGLIFASVGKAIGVVDDRIYAIVVVLVFVTTLITPFGLSAVVKKMMRSETLQKNGGSSL